jgi:hypothetical protein
MSTRESFTLEPIDLVAIDALQAQVGDAEPSRCVWERIRRRAEPGAVARREGCRWGTDDLAYYCLPWARAEGLVTFPDLARRLEEAPFRRLRIFGGLHSSAV